jgi:hypothetical protein
MPVIAIGGDRANGPVLRDQVKLIAYDPVIIGLKDAGHWVLEERPRETMDALNKFL